MREAVIIVAGGFAGIVIGVVGVWLYVRHTFRGMMG